MSLLCPQCPAKLGTLFECIKDMFKDMAGWSTVFKGIFLKFKGFRSGFSIMFSKKIIITYKSLLVPSTFKSAFYVKFRFPCWKKRLLATRHTVCRSSPINLIDPPPLHYRSTIWNRTARPNIDKRETCFRT